MKLRSAFFGFSAICVASLMPANMVKAQTAGDSALLNALVKKGVLSNSEAEDIEAQDQKDYNSTAASKITLASSIKTITFYGDLRLRYEMRDGTVPGGVFQTGAATAAAKAGDSETLNRWRYRLRFGIKGTLYDNFFFGIRAATNPYYDRSGNVTFGASDSAGPFGKDRSLLALDQVYLGWHATDDITLIGGQMPNPFYTTSMVWDDNLNPAGAAEQYDHTFDNDLEVFATAGQFVYQSGAGNGITNGIGANSANYNTFMFGEQIGMKYNFDKNTFFKGGASFYTYSGSVGNASATTVSSLYSTTPINLGTANASPAYFNGSYVGGAPGSVSNVSGINDLAVLEVPMEFDFKIGPGSHTVTSGDPKDMKSVTTEGWSLPVRLFADFAYNVDADERADAARTAIDALAANNKEGSTYANTGLGVNSFSSTAAGTVGKGMSVADVAENKSLLGSTTVTNALSTGKDFLDQSAYQVGIEVGQLKKKGDWDGKLFWQSTGYYAVDPNLIDADIFNAATNMQGAVVSVAHNWTDGLSSTLRYAYAMPVNSLLATPSVNQDLTIGDVKKYNLFQADLMWKF